MVIAPDVGTTFQLGPYIVRIGLRPDNPAFSKFMIFKGDLLIGKQFSRPCLSDCEWLERRRGVYATNSFWFQWSMDAQLRSIDGIPAGTQRVRRRGPKSVSRANLEEALDN